MGFTPVVLKVNHQCYLETDHVNFRPYLEKPWGRGPSICILSNLPGDFNASSSLSPILALSGKESACQCRRCSFDPWVGKMPWRRKWLPIPVFLPEKSHGQRSLQSMGLQKSQIWLSDWAEVWSKQKDLEEKWKKKMNFFSKSVCIWTRESQTQMSKCFRTKTQLNLKFPPLAP